MIYSISCNRPFPESQGQNLALTVLYVPYSLDRGTVSLCVRVKVLPRVSSKSFRSRRSFRSSPLWTP